VKELSQIPADVLAAASRDLDRDFEGKKLVWYQRAKPLVDKQIEEARRNPATLNAARLAAWREQIAAAMQIP